MTDTPHDDTTEPGSGHGDTDPTAARLRAAMHAEAAMVQPPDTLTTIRERTESEGRPWWRHPGALAVAAAVVIGLLVGGGVALLGGDDEDPTVVAADPTESDASTEPTSTESGSATPSATPVPVEGDVYVYYVMDDPVSGPRLYREQQPGIGGDPATTGLQLALAGDATDPDYGSPWPADTTVFEYAVTGDLATVDLSRFVSAGAETEMAAVQQLVYTVTANDKAVKRVRFLVNGLAPSSGHSDWFDPVGRAPMVDVQGLIWLLAPGEGATVASPVEISGYGTAFEGTISWDVRLEGSDEVVAEGFTQGGANGEFGEFSDSVELEPGTYVLRAFESSAENGEAVHVDTKTFTVE